MIDTKDESKKESILIRLNNPILSIEIERKHLQNYTQSIFSDPLNR